jgi:hypothetical protein
MAGITSSFRLPEPEEFDYSKSHRAVPVPSVGYSSTQARRAPEFGSEPGQPREKVGETQQSPLQHQREGADGGKRRGSFSSLLHRSTSHGASADAPPVPSTRIAQAHAQAAAAKREEVGVGGSQFEIVSGSRNRPPQQQQQQPPPQAQPYPALSSATTSSAKVVVGEGGNKMLRKSSKVRQAEQERLAREAALQQQQQMPRQPPRLPSMPNLQEQDDSRPDSFAIFNSGQYQTRSTAPPLPHAAPANFSRPGNTSNMPSATYNNSSSPAYALRPGNAFAQQASSSPGAAQAKTANGEYGAPIDRSESMAHRGRYSYASTSGQPVNAVNSPRRVRRRKDPTPFK